VNDFNATLSLQLQLVCSFLILNKWGKDLALNIMNATASYLERTTVSSPLKERQIPSTFESLPKNSIIPSEFKGKIKYPEES
jgi:hypothetical protein